MPTFEPAIQLSSLYVHMGPPNLLDTLLELGEYTTIVDVIYNHYDRFGNLVGKLIENKMAVHRGPPSLSFSSWTSCCTEVPPPHREPWAFKHIKICQPRDFTSTRRRCSSISLARCKSLNSAR